MRTEPHEITLSDWLRAHCLAWQPASAARHRLPAGIVELIVYYSGYSVGTTPVNSSEQSDGMFANVAEAQSAGGCSIPCNCRKRRNTGSW